MKIIVREATLNLQKPYSSARLRLLAVSGSASVLGNKTASYFF
jgi:hypothetical protein